ncbi:MAG: GTP cyclohydrolase IIa, partial [Nitrososphaeraceae archaeon]
MTIQMTIIRIEGYGPWTLTLGSDREGVLQMLQARIYYDVQRLFSERESLVFANRFDEYFAITNGLSTQDHILIQKELEKIYNNLKLSMTIGNGMTSFEANMNAYNARRT